MLAVDVLARRFAEAGAEMFHYALGNLLVGLVHC
jgi:hypothetical protein